MKLIQQSKNKVNNIINFMKTHNSNDNNYHHSNNYNDIARFIIGAFSSRVLPYKSDFSQSYSQVILKLWILFKRNVTFGI